MSEETLAEPTVPAKNKAHPCFVLMPFGIKKDTLGRPTDFDSVYQQIIRPAVIKAGLDPIRADEERVGGAIHKPMFERLMLCPYAVADITGANPNVYYELGIRHARRPRSTVVLYSQGTMLPFDIAMLRCIPYAVDEKGEPLEVPKHVDELAEILYAARNLEQPDSPVYQLLDEIPSQDVEHSKTDFFRDRAQYSEEFKDRLHKARKDGKKAVLEVATDSELDNLNEVEVGVIVDVFLSMRAVKAHAEMIAFYKRMPEVLKRLKLIREQYGFALNREGLHEEAETVLKDVIAKYGPSSETNGLLGRVYKDLWEKNINSLTARTFLKQAVASYTTGFQADWRDAFPGINALTLMEMMEPPPPEQAEMLPVVYYAAAQKAKTNPDYWDYATLMEIAVLGRKQDAAVDHLSAALTKGNESWMLETTERNLRLIRELRERRGEAGAGWSKAIEDELRRKAESIMASQSKIAS